MKRINLERNRFHGDWNYVIRPHRPESHGQVDIFIF